MCGSASEPASPWLHELPPGVAGHRQAVPPADGPEAEGRTKKVPLDAAKSIHKDLRSETMATVFHGESEEFKRVATIPTKNKVQEQGHLIGCAGCSPGEDRMRQRAEFPIGTIEKRGEQGSLVGSFPEALCGEAQRGQSRNNRSHIRQQHSATPMGK